jgi:hypothetical protein
MATTKKAIAGLKVPLNVTTLWISDLNVKSIVPYNQCGFNRIILYKGAIYSPERSVADRPPL